MAEDLIRYDVLAQEALRGVVRRVLIDAGRDGLPGEHHFFIAFDTRHPGVRISDRLREKHPEEMTIVLQHQFWDLIVTDHTFEVGLSFGNVPERLLVPFEALKGFFDPSVQFGLQFELQDDDEVALETDEADEASNAPLPIASLPTPSKKADGNAATKTSKTKTGDAAVADGSDETDGDEGDTAQVVSLDAFRKKS